MVQELVNPGVDGPKQRVHRTNAQSDEQQTRHRIPKKGAHTVQILRQTAGQTLQQQHNATGQIAGGQRRQHSPADHGHLIVPQAFQAGALNGQRAARKAQQQARPVGNGKSNVPSRHQIKCALAHRRQKCSQRRVASKGGRSQAHIVHQIGHCHQNAARNDKGQHIADAVHQVFVKTAADFRRGARTASLTLQNLALAVQRRLQQFSGMVNPLGNRNGQHPLACKAGGFHLFVHCQNHRIGLPNFLRGKRTVHAPASVRLNAHRKVHFPGRRAEALRGNVGVRNARGARRNHQNLGGPGTVLLVFLGRTAFPRQQVLGLLRAGSLQQALVHAGAVQRHGQHGHYVHMRRAVLGGCDHQEHIHRLPVHRTAAVHAFAQHQKRRRRHCYPGRPGMRQVQAALHRRVALPLALCQVPCKLFRVAEAAIRIQHGDQPPNGFLPVGHLVHQPNPARRQDLFHSHDGPPISFWPIPHGHNFHFTIGYSITYPLFTKNGVFALFDKFCSRSVCFLLFFSISL